MKNLGFGCMRLPLLDAAVQTSFDRATLNKMVDTFLERGFLYFDTAYAYHGFKSEEAIREALVKRHKRGAFVLATKLPLRTLRAARDQEKIFNEQLQKCGVEFFDYYLLHSLGEGTYAQARKHDSFSFILNKKKDGKIKNAGMSFHDTPELLDEILTAHPALDFVQLQINYVDWENPGIQSRRCYEVARRHNMPIIAMAPVKGGTLAHVPEKAEALMKAYAPDASIPSWAIRYAASQEGVMMVLSGMSTLDQVLDNTAFMADFKPLVAEEYKIIRQVTDLINENTAVACTACRYCEASCYKKIAIPDYFALYNSAKRTIPDTLSSQRASYLNLTATHGKAGACIGCRMCEQVCPQHLKISEHLQDVSNLFDNAPALPTK